MKKLFVVVFIPLLFALQASAQTTPEVIDTVNGVWLYSTITKNDPTTFKDQNPMVKGAFLGVRWDSIEPQNNKFNWTIFDQCITSNAQAKLYMNLIFWVGPFAPSWLYNASTPGNIESFKTDDTKNPDFIYPDYKNPAYINYWYRMIDSVTAHINKMAPYIKNRIYIYQSAEGTTGDAVPYHGKPLNSKYAITQQEWRVLKEAAWLHTDSALFIKNKLTKTHFMLNLGSDLGESESYAKWISNNLPNIWLKEQYTGNMYQMNNEVQLKAAYDPFINVANKECRTQLRTRSELGGKAYGANTWFKQDSVWNFYYIHMAALHFGLDMNMQFSDNIANDKNQDAINFFDKYAGFKSPGCAPGAFSVLRDALDAADTVRFPSSMYGYGTALLNDQTGITRSTNIALAFKAFGAKQEDPTHAQGNSWNQQLAKKMNDVGWNIFPGNYERYLTQLSPNETSIGHWRIGPHDQPYGRFARGTSHKAKKDTLFFDVNSNLFNTYPLNAKQSVDIKVIYLDAGIGTWRLQYDAVGNPSKVAVLVKKTNTNKWKEITITVNDANFGDKGPRKSDIMLVNNDNYDDVFHMVEITKGAIIPAPQLLPGAPQADDEVVQVDEKPYLKIYPNPASAMVNIETNAIFEGKVNIQIIDSWGNIMLNNDLAVQPKYSFNIGFLKSGIYQIKISNGTKTISRKLVKI